MVKEPDIFASAQFEDLMSSVVNIFKDDTVCEATRLVQVLLTDSGHYLLPIHYFVGCTDKQLDRATAEQTRADAEAAR